MKPCIRIIAVLFLLATAVWTTGCVTKLESNVTPGTNLDEAKTFYVVRLPKDQRGVEKLIADRLNLMGKQATSGEKSAMPAEVDVVVTYQDKWTWDMTMYMIELSVQLRQPKTDMAMATGHSMRTSLVRKSPTDMVDEVLTDIFKKK